MRRSGGRAAAGRADHHAARHEDRTDVVRRFGATPVVPERGEDEAAAGRTPEPPAGGPAGPEFDLVEVPDGYRAMDERRALQAAVGGRAAEA